MLEPKHLGAQPTREEFARLFEQHFPWLAEPKPVTSLAKQAESHEPDQRGFIIGPVRL